MKMRSHLNKKFKKTVEFKEDLLANIEETTESIKSVNSRYKSISEQLEKFALAIKQYKTNIRVKSKVFFTSLYNKKKAAEIQNKRNGIDLEVLNIKIQALEGENTRYEESRKKLSKSIDKNYAHLSDREQKRIDLSYKLANKTKALDQNKRDNLVMKLAKVDTELHNVRVRNSELKSERAQLEEKINFNNKKILKYKLKRSELSNKIEEYNKAHNLKQEAQYVAVPKESSSKDLQDDIQQVPIPTDATAKESKKSGLKELKSKFGNIGKKILPSRKKVSTASSLDPAQDIIVKEHSDHIDAVNEPQTSGGIVVDQAQFGDDKEPLIPKEKKGKFDNMFKNAKKAKKKIVKAPGKLAQRFFHSEQGAGYEPLVEEPDNIEEVNNTEQAQTDDVNNVPDVVDLNNPQTSGGVTVVQEQSDYAKSESTKSKKEKSKSSKALNKVEKAKKKEKKVVSKNPMPIHPAPEQPGASATEYNYFPEDIAALFQVEGKTSEINVESSEVKQEGVQSGINEDIDKTAPEDDMMFDKGEEFKVEKGKKPKAKKDKSRSGNIGGIFNKFKKSKAPKASSLDPAQGMVKEHANHVDAVNNPQTSEFIDQQELEDDSRDKANNVNPFADNNLTINVEDSGSMPEEVQGSRIMEDTFEAELSQEATTSSFSKHSKATSMENLSPWNPFNDDSTINTHQYLNEALEPDVDISNMHDIENNSKEGANNLNSEPQTSGSVTLSQEQSDDAKSELTKPKKEKGKPSKQLKKVKKNAVKAFSKLAQEARFNKDKTYKNLDAAPENPEVVNPATAQLEVGSDLSAIVDNSINANNSNLPTAEYVNVSSEIEKEGIKTHGMEDDSREGANNVNPFAGNNPTINVEDSGSMPEEVQGSRIMEDTFEAESQEATSKFSEHNSKATSMESLSSIGDSGSVMDVSNELANNDSRDVISRSSTMSAVLDLSEASQASEHNSKATSMESLSSIGDSGSVMDVSNELDNNDSRDVISRSSTMSAVLDLSEASQASEHNSKSTSMRSLSSIGDSESVMGVSSELDERAEVVLNGDTTEYKGKEEVFDENEHSSTESDKSKKAKFKKFTSAVSDLNFKILPKKKKEHKIETTQDFNIQDDSKVVNGSSKQFESSHDSKEALNRKEDEKSKKTKISLPFSKKSKVESLNSNEHIVDNKKHKSKKNKDNYLDKGKSKNKKGSWVSHVSSAQADAVNIVNDKNR